jgi:predicted metal-dependent phosphoesterase TrpH
MTARLGRADLHIHTLASDGTSGLDEILEHAIHVAALDVIAITDHERADAAFAARQMAISGDLPIEVVVGEEVTTLGGHLLALYIQETIRPLRSLRATIAAIHEQGGIAVPAHPLVPYPLCAQGFALRRLLADPDARVHPDGLETFNPTALGRPWHTRVVRFAADYGLAAVGSSDAHAATAVGTGYTTFPGRTAEDLRLAILERTTQWHGSFHGSRGQLGTFGRQLRKYSRDARDEVAGRLRRDGTGRDHGYPGGRLRPPRYEPAVPAPRATSGVSPAASGSAASSTSTASSGSEGRAEP